MCLLYDQRIPRPAVTHGLCYSALAQLVRIIYDRKDVAQIGYSLKCAHSRQRFSTFFHSSSQQLSTRMSCFCQKLLAKQYSSISDSEVVPQLYFREISNSSTQRL